MSAQNIIANIHPNRESNLEIFKRYNPEMGDESGTSKLSGISIADRFKN